MIRALAIGASLLEMTENRRRIVLLTILTFMVLC